jgi:uncharacterized protein with HEPN domain
MQPEERDAAHLWNLLVASRRIQGFIAGVGLTEYIRHALLPSAVERQFEILGEETRKLSNTFREKHPEIPWRQMVGLRNILAHRYYAVDHQRLWNMMHDELPRILDQIERLVPPPPPTIDEP